MTEGVLFRLKEFLIPDPRRKRTPGLERHLFWATWEKSEFKCGIPVVFLFDFFL